MQCSSWETRAPCPAQGLEEGLGSGTESCPSEMRRRPPGLAFPLGTQLACNRKADFAQLQLALNHCTPSHAKLMEHLFPQLTS